MKLNMFFFSFNTEVYNFCNFYIESKIISRNNIGRSEAYIIEVMLVTSGYNLEPLEVKIEKNNVT